MFRFLFVAVARLSARVAVLDDDQSRLVCGPTRQSASATPNAAKQSGDASDKKRMSWEGRNE